jgi:putative peptide zinc metalloprotease protein
MPVDRPTFSESWYRVSALKPRLRGSVQVHRQHFRGQMWHVLQDPSNNQFFRLNEAAYRFVALLDGRRTVAETWKICNEQLGDNSPTQGEAIQLLGQLYSSNLLQAELAPDAEGLFNRYRKRVSREVRGYLMNLLFIRIPILDPDRFLDAWVGIVGRIFTWYGFILWAILLCVGGYFALSHYDKLVDQTTRMLDQANLATNLPLMYLSFALIKAIHEFGHAFACKKFGAATGSGGEVHVMGIMFLVLTPVPYVDASSSWAFRQKWHRIIVGGAGMMVEMAVASIAAIIWAWTPDNPTAHSLAYNAMVIGSVTTLLFNGNPLLRYDGYYMLSDLLEIPNLAQRSKDYVYYLVKKYVWGVKNPRNPAHTVGEKAWFIFYGVASTIYRTIVVVAILFFIAQKLFMVGVILALAASVAWVCVPIFKFIHYLATNGELMRVRGRAIGTVLIFLGVMVFAFRFVPYPDLTGIPGVVEPVSMKVISARGDGFVRGFLPSGQYVQAGDPKHPLIQADNPELSKDLAVANAELTALQEERKKALAKGEIAAAGYYDQAASAKRQEIAYFSERLANLSLLAPIDGEWVAPQIERVQGRYVTNQQQLGELISKQKFIRAAAPQKLIPRLKEAWFNGQMGEVEIRVLGHPEVLLKGKISKIYPAGSRHLFSPAMSNAMGGSIATDPKDQHGTKAVDEFYEVQIDSIYNPDPKAKPPVLFSGQRVMVRVELPEKPLAVQWWQSLLQLIQQKFQM